MSELIQPVNNGKIEKTSNTAGTSKASADNTLGKDAFLKLLVTQMKYQDPLNPSTDTEYIAQLATFSQLEQLQNLSNMTSNSQALSLVGKNVVIKTESSSGSTKYISGTVDYVTVSGGKAYLSVDGKLYSIDDLNSVIDETYILEMGRPFIEKKAELVYDAENPADISFKVNLGDGESKADEVALWLNGKLLDSSVVSLKDSTIVIDKSVFENLSDGTYDITVRFNDPLLTLVKNMVTVTVKNSEADENQNQAEDGKSE